jgi:hypothetical protein
VDSVGQRFRIFAEFPNAAIAAVAQDTAKAHPARSHPGTAGVVVVNPRGRQIDVTAANGTAIIL